MEANDPRPEVLAMKKILSLLLSLTLCGMLCACDASEQPQTTEPAQTASATAASSAAATDSRSAEQAVLEQAVKDNHFEGVITLTRGGKLVAQQATGVADPQTGAAITPDSLFCVGSLAKQFTAAAVLLLQERGALSVDDTLGKHFPECPYGDQITLRQMLHMQSGIAEFYEVIPDGHNMNELPVGELRQTVTNSGTKEGNRQLLQEWLFAQPLTFTPGSATEYCNSNYFLLARLAEKAAGVPYETFVRENILKPLGMQNTGFIDDMLDDPRLAKNAQPAQTVYVGVTMGLGDLVTNAADMQRWMTSFFGNELLRAESIAQMTDGSAGYGFGVVPAGNGMWYHTGIFTAYSAFDFVAPQQQACLFAVTNNQAAMTGGISDMCVTLAQRLLV